MPTAHGLQGIVDGVYADPGLQARISNPEIEGGADGARIMNAVILEALQATGAMADSVVTPEELRAVSDYIRAIPDLYARFIEGHGDDEGNIETAFHLVQGDGGSLIFQGRNFVDTVADAIYHVGFEYRDGRFRNEDGNANEQVDDVAGWINYYLTGVNRVFGTNGNDTLYSGAYSAALADAANEEFRGGAGNDKIWAGDGNDVVFAGTGNDESGGGKGNDQMMGQEGDDALWGDDGDDVMSGGLGADTLGGGKGHDRLLGQEGNDTLHGDDGHDMLQGGDGADVLDGGAGHDWMIGGSGDDKLWSGIGNNLLDGGDGNDELSGDNGADRMIGGAGNDKIYTGLGNDVAYGGDGDDEIGDQGGSDRLEGNGGNDIIWAGGGGDVIYGGSGNDVLGGGDGGDGIRGEAGADEIHGQNGGDMLDGGADNDKLWGGDGVDMLIGGSGTDILSGGNGADVFVGGTGADELLDWEDNDARDTFVFALGDSGKTEGTIDVIAGFTSGRDMIDLSAIPGLSFVDTIAFSGTGAEVRFDGDYVLIDADGSGTTDMAIELRWVNVVAESDFILG